MFEVECAFLFWRHLTAYYCGRDHGFHGASSGYVMSHQYEGLLKRQTLRVAWSALISPWMPTGCALICSAALNSDFV